ncbi:MAG: sugar ABC transporter permease [Bifidobacterium psychraerophilum]|uniref:carbohydrate ABC transporter permease n=1 Tax=Bifidobacterium psychraerophilum TaxID=218140 RepID=UPI0039EB6263
MTTTAAPTPSLSGQPEGGAGVKPGKSNKAITRRNARVGITFVLPALIILSVFVFYPTISTFFTSFTSNRINRDGVFVGFDNYIRLFQSADFWTDFKNTLIYAVIYAPLVVIIALALAMLLNRKDIRGIGFFRTCMFLPFVISLTVASIAWSFLLSPSLGLVPYWMDKLFGIQNLDLLGNRSTALATIIAITVWKNFGYFMVIFIAGLQGISAELYEAASLDGASAWQKFRFITVPGLRPTFNYVIIFGLIGSFQVFDQIFIMTSGGPDRSTETIVYRIYVEAFGNGKLGYASALSYVLLIMTLIVGVIQLVSNSKHEKEELA